MIRPAAALLCAALFAAPALAAESAPAASSATAPAEAAAPRRPALVVDTLAHGRFDLQARRGRWTVVNFWATWCAPCRKEMPDLDALDARRADLDVIGLAYEEISADDMRAFLRDSVPVSYPVAILDVYAPPADFDTPRGLPLTHLVDPDGVLAKTWLGPVTGAEIEAAIAAHAP